MNCLFCGVSETKVVDSRFVAESNKVKRRRECSQCGERFTTFESIDLALPHVVKHNGIRQEFDETKLRNGLLLALRKRPVSTEKVDAILDLVLHNLLVNSEREVSSTLIGEWVMTELRQLDAVAYVRFASVYLSFQDVSEFKDAIKELRA
jgi:transcriptional repressor NrdR